MRDDADPPKDGRIIRQKPAMNWVLVAVVTVIVLILAFLGFVALFWPEAS